MTFEVGNTISLKPRTGDGHSGRCLAEAGTDSDSLFAKIIMGEPRSCWHGPCKLIRVFEDDTVDEGLLIENRHGYIRRANTEEIMRRY